MLYITITADVKYVDNYLVSKNYKKTRESTKNNRSVTLITWLRNAIAHTKQDYSTYNLKWSDILIELSYEVTILEKVVIDDIMEDS